jgi:membrane protease YdiL (CAAX protease family)
MDLPFFREQTAMEHMKTIERAIVPPERSSTVGTWLIIGTVILLTVNALSVQRGPGVALSAALLLIAALAARSTPAIHLALLTLFMAAMPLLHPQLRFWPFSLVLPILLFCICVLPVARHRAAFLQWLRPGYLGKDILVLVVITAAVSGAGLILWHRLAGPDLSVQLGHMPTLPVWMYPAAGLVFALTNAAVEEFVFRGVMMQALDAAFGPRTASVVIQAWAFGAMHYLRGFPSGVWGVALAFGYGILLGIIRRRSRGMAAPWLAHVFADIVIFIILVSVVFRT